MIYCCGWPKRTLERPGQNHVSPRLEVEKYVRPQPVRVAIDLETTGLRPEADAIIEVGAVKFAGAQVIETFQSFVTTNTMLPYRIQRLTSITPKQLRRAPTLGMLIPRLRAFLGDAPLVGHSVQFDAAFLRRAGLAWRNPLIDTYELAAMLLPGLPSYTLASVGQAVNAPASTYHRALADAQLAREVFLALLQRLEDLDPSTIEALDHLAAPPNWTPHYLARGLARAQSRDQARQETASPFGALLKTSLGQRLEASLGVDPGVLSMAVGLAGDAATQPPPYDLRAPEIAGHLAYSPAPMPEATQAQEAARERQVSESVMVRLVEGGVALVEVERGDDSALACLSPIVQWVSEVGADQAERRRVVICAADSEQMMKVARGLLPLAIQRADLPPDAIRIAEVDEDNAYLCLHRWFGIARDARGATLSHDLTRGLAKLVVWSKETLTGARNEITLVGAEALAWERARAGADLADTTDGCAYRRGGYCFTLRTQRAAEAASLIVTTHAALATALAGQTSLLPSIEALTRVVVLDAHLLEEGLRRNSSIAFEQQSLLDMLATLGEQQTDQALPNVNPKDTRPQEGAYVGLLPLAASLLAGRDVPRWRPTARERGWFETLALARTQVEALFGALRATLAEAQNENAKGQNGAGAGNKGASHSGSQPHFLDGRRQSGQGAEPRMLLLDKHTRETGAWTKACEAWQTLDMALDKVATLAREVAQQTRIASQSSQENARGGGKRGRDKDANSAQNTPHAAHAPLPPSVALGLTTDLLAIARQIDKTRAQGLLLFSHSAEAHGVARWLRLPYTNELPPASGTQFGHGKRERHQHEHTKQPPRDAATTQTNTAARPTGPTDTPHAPTAPSASPERLPGESDQAAQQGVSITLSTEKATPASQETADESLIAEIDPADPAMQEASETVLVGAEIVADKTSVEMAAIQPDAQTETQSGEQTHEQRPIETPVLHAAPTHVGELLRPLLGPGRALTLAGWALSVGGDFEYMRGALALPESTTGVALTPDYSHQTLLCLPKDVPEPNAPHFQQRLDEAIVALAIALGGQLVALFPSHAALRSGALGVKRALERNDILTLAQGIDGSARQLWQTFHSQPRVVLLGAGSFWDGADQREGPPACVLITRLPFPALSDPLVAARAEGWADPQTQFVTPQAALKLRQALGGLAWSHQRRNAVVLFDRRLQTRGYGPTILGVLPRCTQAQEPMAQLIERIGEWTQTDASPAP